MRKLFFVVLTITTMFTFSACGSDDEKEQVFFNGDCKQTISLESGVGGNTVITSPVKSELDDMLKNSSGFGSPVATGEFHVNGSNTMVKITGLPNGVILKNFSLNINGLKHDFGDRPVDNTNLYTGNADYFQKVFDQMIKNKYLETIVTFTPTEKVSANVKLEMVFSGRFSYWQKK